MKVFQARGSSLCLQPYGQPITTVLCFIPPRPQDWIKWMMPSRTLDATTTWQKPLTLSISIMFLIAYNMRRGQINKSIKINSLESKLIITIKVVTWNMPPPSTLFEAIRKWCCLGNKSYTSRTARQSKKMQARIPTKLQQIQVDFFLAFQRWFTCYPRGFFSSKLTGGSPRVIYRYMIYWMSFITHNSQDDPAFNNTNALQDSSQWISTVEEASWITPGFFS